MMRVVAFKIDEELLERLDALAMKSGISRSELIREAIAELVSSKELLMRVRYRRFRVRKVVIV